MIKFTFLNSLKSNGFFKNASTLIVGTAASQVLPLIFYPILTRIYSPSDFGLLASLAAITSILATVSTGKYEFSILITKKKNEAASVIHLVLILSFFTLLLSSILIYFFSESIGETLNNRLLSKWLFLAPINAFLIIVFNLYNEWCVKNKYFISLSWNKVINAGGITFAKFLLGCAKFFSFGLIIGETIGRSISAFSSVIKSIKNDRKTLLHIDKKDIIVQSKRYINFPKFTLPAQLMNTLGGQLPIFLLGVYFSRVEVGYFSMTFAILSVPITIISSAIKDVFRQRANEELNKKNSCRFIYVKLLKILAVFSVFSLCLFYNFLPKIFQFGLGDRWIIAGQYAQICSPMILLSFISNSLGGVLIITENLKIAFLWQIYYASMAFLSLIIGNYYFNSIKLVLLSYSVAMSSAYILQIFLSYKYSENKVNNKLINN